MDFRQLKGTKYSGNIALFRHMLKHLYAQRTHHEFRKSGSFNPILPYSLYRSHVH